MWTPTENKVEIILIRHGKCKGNLEKRYIGAKTDEDILKSEYDCIKEAEYDRIYVSPMKRCIQTAKAISSGSKKILVEEFIETDFGIFENKNYEELKDNVNYISWLDSNCIDKIPEGESLEELKQRVIKGFNRIIHDDKNVVIVAHGGTIMSIMSYLTGNDFYEFFVNNLDGYRVELSLIGEEIKNVSFDSISYRVHT